MNVFVCFHSQPSLFRFLLNFRFCKSVAYCLDDALRTHCGSRYDIHISRLSAYHLRNYFRSNIVEMFIGIIILYNRNIGDFITFYGYTYLYARLLSRAFSRVYAVRVLACGSIRRFFYRFFCNFSTACAFIYNRGASAVPVVLSVSVVFPSVPPELQPPKTAKANNTDIKRLIALFLSITLTSLPVQESYKRNLHEFCQCPSNQAILSLRLLPEEFSVNQVSRSNYYRKRNQPYNKDDEPCCDIKQQVYGFYKTFLDFLEHIRER